MASPAKQWIAGMVIWSDQTLQANNFADDPNPHRVPDPVNDTSWNDLLTQLADINTTGVAGDIIYWDRNTLKWKRLARGPNQQSVLHSGTIAGNPFWSQIAFSDLSGTAAQGQITHGHSPQTYNVIGTLTVPPDPFTTTSTTAVNLPGMAVTMTARNAGQGLNALVVATIAAKMSAGIGFFGIKVDTIDQGISLPISTTNYTAISLVWTDTHPDATAHTYQITARSGSAANTLSVAETSHDPGAGTGTFMLGNDAGMATNIA